MSPVQFCGQSIQQRLLLILRGRQTLHEIHQRILFPSQVKFLHQEVQPDIDRVRLAQGGLVNILAAGGRYHKRGREHKVHNPRGEVWAAHQNGDSSGPPLRSRTVIFP